MKTINRLLAFSIIAFVLYFATKKSPSIDLGGSWIAKKIVLDGKQFYPTEINKYITYESPVSINNWTNTLNVTDDINARFELEEQDDGNYIAKLASKEKSLNGSFKVILDTTILGPLAYTVDLKLKSLKTIIHVQKHVKIKPYKPKSLGKDKYYY